MDFEEIKERYKMLPLWARFLIAGILGLLPGAYVYYDEGDALQTQLETTTGEEGEARAKFEEARQQKANVPKLEEELEFTEQQLEKAKKKLPDIFHIEDVLQKAATIAKEVGVKLVKFEPQEDILHREDYKFVEKPIKTEIEGRFGQIAAFFDRIVHLETSVFVRKIDVTRVVKEKNDEAEPGPQAQRQKTEFQLAKEARQNLRLRASFDIAMFRGMSKDEEEHPAKVDGENAVPGEKPAKGKDKGDPDAPSDAPVPPTPAETTSARKAPTHPDDVTTF